MWVPSCPSSLSRGPRLVAKEGDSTSRFLCPRCEVLFLAVGALGDQGLGPGIQGVWQAGMLRYLPEAKAHGALSMGRECEMGEGLVDQPNHLTGGEAEAREDGTVP